MSMLNHDVFYQWVVKLSRRSGSQLKLFLKASTTKHARMANAEHERTIAIAIDRGYLNMNFLANLLR
jgi:hypothetical protein